MKPSFKPMIAALSLAFGLALPASALEEQAQGNVRFVSGGVGETEIAEIKAMSPAYSLQVLTADRAGQFVSGVHVTILRGGASVLDTDLDGPYLLVKLPPGAYRLKATFEGRNIERNLVIGQKRQTVDLHW